MRPLTTAMLTTLSALLLLQCQGPPSRMFGKLIRPQVVLSSHTGGPSQAGATVIRSRAAWKAEAIRLGLADEHRAEMEALHGPIGAMDWQREMLVVVGAGLQPSGGFEIEPWRVTTAPSGSWKLVARLTVPGDDEMVTMAMTAPYTVLRMPALRGEPSFHIERKVRGS